MGGGDVSAWLTSHTGIRPDTAFCQHVSHEYIAVILNATFCCSNESSIALLS